MSEVLNGYQPRKPGRPTKYPWPEWLDGKTRRLRRARDFAASLDSMELLIRRTAKKFPEVEAVTIHHEPDALVVTAILFPKKRRRRAT